MELLFLTVQVPYNQKYSVESNIYSIKQDKLIWSGLTETADPGGVDKLVVEISNKIHKKMLEEGFYNTIIR